MGADSRQTRSQESRSSLGQGDACWGALVLCAVLGVTGCKIGSSLGDSNSGDGGGSDGGKRDAKSSEVSGTSDAAAQPKTCAPDAPGKSKGKAESCSCDRECQTGFCVSGICCTSACAENCKGCNLPSALGDCAFVPSGVRPNDPLVCAASTPATCGHDGTCDGKGACQAWPSGTSCGQASCADDPNKASTVTPVATCDSSGKCQSGTQTQCYDYLCDPNSPSCRSSCN